MQWKVEGEEVADLIWVSLEKSEKCAWKDCVGAMEAVGGGSVVAAVVALAVLVVGASDKVDGVASCCAC
eukprot:15025108-Ditylum_brightwellii.AAC.1